MFGLYKATLPNHSINYVIKPLSKATLQSHSINYVIKPLSKNNATLFKNHKKEPSKQPFYRLSGNEWDIDF